MDGTLADSSLTIANAINHVRAHLGLSPLPKDLILSKVNDHTIDAPRFFYGARTFTPLHEKLFSQYYTDNHAKELRLYKGIPELLKSLKKAGKHCAVATNAYRISTLQSLEHLGIASYFDEIICYDDVRNGKPDPEMLLTLLQRTGHTAGESLFIGDSHRDRLAAKAAGMDFVMVGWGFDAHNDAVASPEALLQKIATRA